MEDESVSTRFEDHGTYLSGSSARLTLASTATSRGLGGVTAVKDTMIPLATVADARQTVSLSKGRQEGEVSSMVKARGAASATTSPSTSIQPTLGHAVAIGRRGGRRMPGMVRKSLQVSTLDRSKVENR